MSNAAPRLKKQPAHFLFNDPHLEEKAVFEPFEGKGMPFQPVQVFNPAAQILGDAGSSAALKVLLDNTNYIKRLDTLVLLKEALLAFKRGDWKEGGEFALKALHVDEKSGEAWHILAISREKCADLATALTCYETALKLQPDNPAIANDLGRLAYRLGLNELAEKFFVFFLDKCPGHGEAINNLASVMREANRLDEAIDLLKEAIGHDQTDCQLWNALGTVVNAKGDIATAAIFYREALKYDPEHVHALYNLGNALGVMGQAREGLTYLLRALPMFVDPANIHTCKLSIAFSYLHLGDYEQGWAWYIARDSDDTIDKMHYVCHKPRWNASIPVAGKRIFVSAEQGLGDEVMYASLLPDLLRDIGPDGKLGIGVEKRLVPVFQKAFPTAVVVAHQTGKFHNRNVRIYPDITDWEAWDNWGIMGDFLAKYRSTRESFPTENAFFKPDPERVAYWKAILNGVNDKPKVGLLWKSLIKHSRRDRYYSAFDDWADILAIDGIQIVNLQYGDTSEELAEAEAAGLDIWTPPGIDLKNDLDDLSALCAALDCILGPSNATSNIAGAAGAKIWILGSPNAWNCLGTDHLPWYPTSRVFEAETLLDWSGALAAMHDALIHAFVKR